MSDEIKAPDAGVAPASAAPPATPTHESESTKGMIPSSRLSEVIGERNLFRSQVEDLRKQVAELEPHRTRATELETQFNTAKSAWDEERAFVGAGITHKDAIKVARLFYADVESKPEGGISEWLNGIKADPSTAPLGLAAYLPAVEAPASPDSQVKPRPPAAPPATGRPAPAGASVTLDALKAARAKATLTNSPEDYAAAKTLGDAYLAQRSK